ncbi:MAG: hypothetical protein AAFX81_12735 [Pseudomonadota bacterium]
MDRGLRRVHAEIDARESVLPQPRERGDRPTWRLAWSRTPLSVKSLVGAQAVVATAALIILLIRPAPELVPVRYQLLSESGPVVAEVVWRVRFVEDMQIAQLRSLLEDLELTIAHGPTATGVFTVIPAGADRRDPAVVDARLAAAPLVAVAVRVSP